MNFLSPSRTSSAVLSLLAVSALLVVAACGGGGGTSKNLRLTGTIFGFDPFTGNFGATGQQGSLIDAPVIPQNMCLVFKFSQPVAAKSVSTESIVVQQFDPNTNTPGADAGVTFQVQGNRIIICPLITFSDTNVAFGFEPEQAYQVLFQVPPSGSVIRSASGNPIDERDRGPFFFKTNAEIFDQKVGPPVPTMSLLNPNSGASLGLQSVPFKPVPEVVIDFNEAVIPSTVLSDPDAGASNSISVSIDVDRNVATRNDRIPVPGQFTLTQDIFSAQVRWRSLLTELPTGPDGCVFVVRVNGTVTDISGSSRILDENDPLAGDEFVFVTAPGPAISNADPVAEPFITDDQADDVTSASWGSAVEGFLSAGVGGGRGTDGPFDPGAPDFPPPELAAQIVVDTDNQLVTIDSEDQANPGNPRTYEFLSFDVPLGWTVQGIGPFPLEIQVSGDAVIRGTLSVKGEDATLVDVAANTPGAGGAAALGGAAGGQGGSATDGLGVSTLYPSQGGVPTNAQLGFAQSVNFDADREGVSGRIGAITDFTITDTTTATDLSLAFPDLTEIWLQPNVGADDFRFERFHTAFKVESIAGAPPNQVITVVSDVTDPLYRGSMIAETSNPYLEDAGGGVLRTPLLAEIGDAYVIGALRGTQGSALFDVGR